MHWRKGRDSNPRGPSRALAVFKTAALNHSATLPAVEITSISSGANENKTEFATILLPIKSGIRKCRFHDIGCAILRTQ
jgi:hypothetical protein